jgi:L-ascorbate metabolism protein UlaG (beta-lactamase superfamily)
MIRILLCALLPAQDLADVEAALRRHPPSGDWAERRKIAEALDRLVVVRVVDGMSDADRASLRTLGEFYRRRVDEGLDRLEKTRVAEGVHVFKFYSSSYVLKSAEGTVAIDFAQGPVNNGGEPEARDARRTGFYWTPEQRDRLAGLVDASFITHRHHDHSDYSLSKRLLERGKPVVGPAQLRTLWKDLGDRLRVPDYGRVQKIGPAEVTALLGMQYSRNRKDEAGLRWGEPSRERPEQDSETVAYLIRLGGLVFFQAGENHVEPGPWLRNAAASGFAPDVRMSVGQFQGQRGADEVLKTLPRCFRLPIHEYEMTHEGGGNRMAPLFKDDARAGSQPLFWGEDFLLTRERIESARR